VHAWQRTQDEGWVRAALDTYGVPYTYFSDQKLREGNLRAKYDVIIYPHVGGSATSQVNGIAKNGTTPLPYKKTAATPNLGALDQSDDIRGGMGMDGLLELAKFVQAGGTLITEGGTSTIFPEYGITTGVTVEEPRALFVRGSILRGIISDAKSPIAYGFDGTQLPVYFSQAPVLAVSTGGGGGFGGFGGGGGEGGINGGLGQNTTPMATPLKLSPYEQDSSATTGGARAGASGDSARFQNLAGNRGGAGSGNTDPAARPRVIMTFPQSPNDMLLSGTLAGGQALSGRAQIVDTKLGNGHVVMFAIRPFWRWQTQGTFFLGFNTILNWNDLDAGKVEAPRQQPATSGNQ
jgi:hypothetical protein